MAESPTGPKPEQPTFKCTICFNSTHRTSSRSHSSVGKALDSVWWQHMSRFQKSEVRSMTGARCLSSLLAGMVAVGGRP